jgi:hypothetical protein
MSFVPRFDPSMLARMVKEGEVEVKGESYLPLPLPKMVSVSLAQCAV